MLVLGLLALQIPNLLLKLVVLESLLLDLDLRFLDFVFCFLYLGSKFAVHLLQLLNLELLLLALLLYLPHLHGQPLQLSDFYLLQP